ncbi:MAG: hypothetical protein IJU50_11195, partial [Lachnospiraceae bacterium]|nr:hypothetical protein [Lachnospiraceae bacterium]
AGWLAGKIMCYANHVVNSFFGFFSFLGILSAFFQIFRLLLHNMDSLTYMVSVFKRLFPSPAVEGKL